MIDLDLLATITISPGKALPGEGRDRPCLMQAISHITGEDRWSDQPSCVAAPLIRAGISLNDQADFNQITLATETVDARLARLKALIPRLIGTADLPFFVTVIQEKMWKDALRDSFGQFNAWGTRFAIFEQMIALGETPLADVLQAEEIGTSGVPELAVIGG